MVERSTMANTFSKLQIIDCPIVREQSGLALSSRNERLSDTEKQTALAISRTLFASLQWAKEEHATVQEVQQRVIDSINAIDGLEVEYYQIVDQTTLQPTTTFTNAIGCITVYCGPVRLIDNMKYL
jgi:pantoate--beta-alanine ligase